MPEPITLTVLALLKVLGGKAVMAKMALLIKGLAATAHGQSALVLAKSALVAVHSAGLAAGAAMIAQMLIILGTVAAGSAAAVYARKCLEAANEGRHADATAWGRKALREAGPVWKVWSPA